MQRCIVALNRLAPRPDLVVTSGDLVDEPLPAAYDHLVRLDGHLPPSFTIEPPALHLHAWFPGDRFGTVVTHLVPIGEFEGPYPFFDSAGRYL